MWFRKAPKHRVGEVQNITTFFHPLDIVAEWNRVYGPNGFLQYQFAVPFAEHETFRRCVEMIVTSGHLSCLNVLKRFGPGNAAPLSFPMPGWTLTVDLPIEDGLDRLCNTLDEQVVAAGGRCYLAKDSRLGCRHVPPDVPAARRLPGRPAAGRSRATCSPPTSPGGWPVSAGVHRPLDHRPRSSDHDRCRRQPPVPAAARRHVRHRAGHRPPVRHRPTAAGGAGRPPDAAPYGGRRRADDAGL